MENTIIIGIVLVMVFIGIRSIVKRMKGETSCCGGKSTPVPKQNKSLENVIVQKVVMIEGMTCDHCKNWVEKSINDIDGAAAKVNLKKKEAIVSLATDVSDEQLRTAVEKAGYKVVGIK